MVDKKTSEEKKSAFKVGRIEVKSVENPERDFVNSGSVVEIGVDQGHIQALLRSKRENDGIESA